MLARFDEAEAEIRLARMLDPWSTITIEGEGFIRLVRGQYDEAQASRRTPAPHRR